VFTRRGRSGARGVHRASRLRSRRWFFARSVRPASDDGGFSLIETVVSMALLSIVMTAATTFFVNVLSGSNYLRTKQAAVQVADATMEQVRAFDIKSLVAGRDQSSSDAQWTAGTANAVVAPYLNQTQEVYDSTAATGHGSACSVIPTSSTAACLPTSTQTVTLNGVAYSTNTYLGSCIQYAGSPNCTKGAFSSIASAADVGYYRAVVAVTWPGKSCPANTCTYATVELLNTSGDPVFNLNNGSVVTSGSTNAPLALTSPGNQSTTTGAPVNLQLLYAGGTGQVTWTATLPFGLSIDSTTGVIYGTPVCVPGTCTITVTGTDSIGATSTISFNWTVNQVPQVTTPPDGTTTTSNNGVAISPVSLAASYGTPAYTWSVTGLPTGLSVSGTTISGTPTTDGSYTTVVRVTDTSGKSSTATIAWNVVSAIVNPGAQTVPVGTAVNLALVQHGENSPVWTATGLPAGLTISSSTGKITGTPTQIQTTTSTITANDGVGAPATINVTWTVSGRIGAVGDLAGDCLDVSGNSSADLTPVLAYTCSTGINQVWTIPADSTIRVTSGGAVSCLTASGAVVGSTIISRPCANPNQTWSFAPVSGGYFQIKLGSVCLGAAGTSKANAQQMSLVSCTTNAATRTYWRLGA
jgi:prepilin-type N-terminal cleavage/methylation domain-containing protein